MNRASGHGAPREFDPPPSTMAAQLINNLSTTTKPRQAEQDDLSILMKEVEDLENNAADLIEISSKIEHKHKLIYVFARAVLERLGKDDPFMNVPQLVSQASDALDIFMSTIKETPGVLDYTLQPAVALPGRGQEALWIWLFPQVLTLLGPPQYDSLIEKIKDFFYISFQAVSRSPRLWNLSSIFFCYLKDCATSRYAQPTFRLTLLTLYVAILGHLQEPSVISHGNELELIIPSGVFEQSMFSQDKEGVPSVPLQFTYIIHNAADGLWHATNILSMLVDISTEAAASFDATPAFQDYLAWLLDSFLEVHELQTRWRGSSVLGQSCERFDVLSFCAVHSILSTLRESLSDNVLHKSCIFLSVLCAALLEDPLNVSEKPIRLNLCSCLLSLAATCKHHDSVRCAVSLYLLPVINAILTDNNAAKTLGNDFQVRSLLVLVQLECAKNNTEGCYGVMRSLRDGYA